MNPNELLQLMVKKNISDIHFKANSSPLVRIHGKLISTGLELFSSQNIEEIAYSMMTDEQKAYFERDNELDMSYAIEGVARFRVNAYKQRGTIALTLRVVPVKVKNFVELNLPSTTFEKIASESRGLILVAGVTGAGKTTTMNSLLDYINENFAYNMITVEDPIEYYHKDKKASISQREIGSDTASFSTALKYMLRQDPDVIVLGEMREYTEMSAGITAAETGHLVLGTIHTMDAVQTIARIVDTYPPHQKDSIKSQIASVIKAIVAQRLVNGKDGESVYPATEILIANSLVKKIISEGKYDELYKVMEQGSFYGMHTFDQDLVRLFNEGKITSDEALDKASNPDDLLLKIKMVQ